MVRLLASILRFAGYRQADSGARVALRQWRGLGGIWPSGVCRGGVWRLMVPS